MIEEIPKQTTNIFHTIGFENIFKQKIVLISIKILSEKFKADWLKILKNRCSKLKRKIIIQRKQMKFQWYLKLHRNYPLNNIKEWKFSSCPKYS